MVHLEKKYRTTQFRNFDLEFHVNNAEWKAGAINSSTQPHARSESHEKKILMKHFIYFKFLEMNSTRRWNNKSGIKG